MGNLKSELVSIMKEAGIGDELESQYVAGMVWHHRRTRDILPKITEHQGLQFASRVLVSLGFFKDYMKHLNLRHGAPNPRFYMEVARAEFASEGRFNVANHLEAWTEYLSERFNRKNGNNNQIKGVYIPAFYKTSRYHKKFPDSLAWKRLGPLN